MNDYGTRQTDLAVKRAEWRLSRVYHQAAQDIEQKMKAWQEGHAKREAMYRQQLADGKITQADFDAWMRGQVFQDKQWQARKAEIDRILLNADREAQRIVNEGKIGVFADNANYIGYDLERNGKVNTGFTLYDQNTVARLIKSDPQILPKPGPGVKKDKAYSYYNKLMNSAITQGIIQGETIPQIAKRIAQTAGERSYTSAVRNARTAYTGAQNAGRMEGLHQAQSLGIKVQKKWMATLDNRTRDAHAELDGQVRDVDEPFDSELGPIDYPGDPNADPGNVYNCRCTLVYVYPDYPSEMQRRDNETGEIVGDMTYREWEEWKAGQENDTGKSSDESDETMGASAQHNDATIGQLQSAVGDAYNFHMDRYGVGLVRHEAGKADTPVVVNLDGMDDETQRLFAETVGTYCRKYDTSLQDIHMMTAQEMASTPNGVIAITTPNSITNTSEMALNPNYCSSAERMRAVIDANIRDGFFADVPGENRQAYIFTHEFGHTLITTDTKYTESNNPLNVDIDRVKRIQRRVTGVYKEYTSEVGRLEREAREAEAQFAETFDTESYERGKQLNALLRQTKISGYSLTNADEFFAEAFCYTELGGRGNVFADRVREIIDEEFAR